MKVGFYGGSFDPFTNGHLHVVEKAAEMFDKVIIGIGVNSNKKRKFDSEVVKEAIKRTLESRKIKNVDVICYNKLLVDSAKENGATILIRGIRNGMDYQYEEIMAATNEEISGLDTIYIRAGSLGNISSSLVMELLNNGRDVSKYLPKEVLECLNLKIT